MTGDNQTFDELVEEVAIQENADPEIVRLAFEVQQDIKKNGIRGIRFMGKSAEKMKRLGPMRAKKDVTNELKKRFRD